MTSSADSLEARAELRQAQAQAAARIAGVPSLHLLIWATRDCMRLSLVIYYSRPGQRRACSVLRDAEWRPHEVTQEKLVRWGRDALSSWLAEPSEPLFTAYGAWPK